MQGVPKVIEISSPILEPSDAAEVSADLAEQAILLYSDSHLGRSLVAGERDEETPRVPASWEVEGPGGAITPNPTVTNTGVFEARLTTSRTPGSTYRVRAKLPGSDILATTGAIRVIPGRASDVSLSADRATLPADEASETTVTLTARDQFGNPVADGTLVSWGVAGAGEIDTPTTTTAGGTTTAKYRAGDLEGEASVLARVDGAEAAIRITLARIDLTVTPQLSLVYAGSKDPISLFITATSSAGPPSDSAELVLLGNLGRLQGPDHLVAGQAGATFTPVGLPGQARIMASVTTHRAETVVEVTRPSGLFASPKPAAVVGDRTEDGVVTVEDGSGGLKAIPYQTWTTVTVTGNPGDVVDLKLGGTRSPNVEPIAWYSMDEIEGAGKYHR